MDKCQCSKLPRPHGALGVMMQHILKSSPKEQPSFALAGALCTMSTILGQSYVFKGMSPNLYVLLLGGSGSGKHAPQITSHKMLLDARQSRLLGSGSYVSDASLMDTLADKPTRLDLLDEASGILSTITKGGGEHTGKMADILCNLWSVSNGLFLGRSMAAKKATKCDSCKTTIDADTTRGRCYRPNVNLIMATTYTGLEESVTLSALDKGLLGRFLIFSANEGSMLKTHFSEDELDANTRDLLMGLRDAPIPSNPKYSHKGLDYPVKEIELASGAEGDYEAYYDRMRSIGGNYDVNLTPIIARMPQQFKKIALIHAMGCGRDVVDKADLKFAYAMVVYNLEQFKVIVDKYLFRTALEKEFKIVMRCLSNEPIEMNALVVLLRPFLKRKRLEEIISELTLSNECVTIRLENNEIGVRLC
jgi:hypothetical protein